MKYKFAQLDDNEETTVLEFTREEILKDYFPYWKERMLHANKGHMISEELCLDDC